MKRLILLLTLTLFLPLHAQEKIDLRIPAMKKKEANTATIFATAILARVVEAYRDSEAFQHPLESRSLEWHALKPVQYASIAIYGYSVLANDEPLWKKAAITALSLLSLIHI